MYIYMYAYIHCRCCGLNLRTCGPVILCLELCRGGEKSGDPSVDVGAVVEDVLSLTHLTQGERRRREMGDAKTRETV